MRVIAMALVVPQLLAAGHQPAPVVSTASSASAAALGAKTKSASSVKAVSNDDLRVLKTLDSTYQSKSASMSVDKTTKITLLEQEKKAKGHLYISSGKLRMEFEGAEKSTLIVNKKNLWAVTYPPAEFKDAAIQVIHADTSTKKARSKNFVAMLTQGGILKYFNASGAQKENGAVLFFLTPKQELTDFKRAQVRVSSDGKKLLALNYWDDRDNETRLEFSDVKFEKLDAKLFEFTPPTNADVMNL